MNQQSKKHHLENLMALVLFGVFAVSILATLLMGANVYQRLTERDQQAYHLRVCAQYITTRVRQADQLAGITVDEFGGGDCLTFAEEVDGIAYTTRVYCYDGNLMELLTQENADLSPESGEVIMKAQSLHATLMDGLLTVAVSMEEGESVFDLALRSGEVCP